MNLVPGQGPLDAQICFVGEAPGHKEAAVGIPFIGPAGSLLFDQLARAAGIVRNQCYITNVVKTLPHKSISSFVDLSKKQAVESDAFVEFKSILKEELEQIRPNVVVAVGNVPLWALTGLKGITKWRGSILESTLVPGLKVIPIIHPASVLRGMYKWRHYIQRDLARVLSESVSPDIISPKHDLILAPDFTTSMEFLEDCKKAKEVGFDIEVMHDHISCFSFSIDERTAISIPIQCKAGHYFDPDQETAIITTMGDVLENPDIEKVIQNAIFDSGFVYNDYGIVTNNMFCTMVAHKMLYPEFEAGLDFMTSVLTEVPYYKDEGKIWGKLVWEERDFWRYSALDSVVLLPIKHKLEAQLDRVGIRDSFDIRMAQLHPLHAMTFYGVRTDHNGLQNERDKLEGQIARNQQTLDDLVGRPLNPNSTKQLQDYFYNELNIKPYINRKTKRPTTDATALVRLSTTHGRKEASTILDIRHDRKLLSTYYDAKLDDDGRTRGNYNPAGTRSGRLSSSKTIFGTGLNMQNIPPGMDRYLVADDGYVIISIDLSQAENRVVAYIAPEQKMQAAFERGEDIHALTASAIFKIPPDQISDEPGSAPFAGGKYSQRFWGKKGNHAINYHEGHVTFALQNEMPQKEAKLILDSILAMYPGLPNYWAWIERAIRSDRTLIDCFDKKRIFWGDPRDNDTMREAYSFIPQSTVRQIMDRWGMLYVYNEPELSEVIQIRDKHDSMDLLFPLKHGWRWIAERVFLITRNLEQPLFYRGAEWTIPADVSIGMNLAKRDKDNPMGLKECTNFKYGSGTGPMAAALEKDATEPLKLFEDLYV